MGIYDREYYRSDSRGLSWFSGPQPVCRAIIAINIVVYLCQIFSPQLTGSLVAIPHAVFGDWQVWRLLTAAFAHDPNSPFHLIFNMYLLWLFGAELESLYGTRDFLFLYLTSAIVSILGQIGVDQFLGNELDQVLGASGAVLAVSVIYAMFYPHRELTVLFLIRMEVWVLVAFGVAADLLLLVMRANTGTAYAAHVFGAAYGFAFKTFDLRPSRLTTRRWRQPKLRIVRAEPRERDRDREREREVPITRGGNTRTPEPVVSIRSPISAVIPEEQLDARLDEVLAKIAREGRANLSEEENRILQEASKRARNRRSDRP